MGARLSARGKRKKSQAARDGSEAQTSPDTGTGSQDMRQYLLLSVHHCHQLRGAGLSERGNLYAVPQVNDKAASIN